jgi:hypothetical protein
MVSRWLSRHARDRVPHGDRLDSDSPNDPRAHPETDPPSPAWLPRTFAAWGPIPVVKTPTFWLCGGSIASAIRVDGIAAQLRRTGKYAHSVRRVEERFLRGLIPGLRPAESINNHDRRRSYTSSQIPMSGCRAGGSPTNPGDGRHRSTPPLQPKTVHERHRIREAPLLLFPRSHTSTAFSSHSVTFSGFTVQQSDSTGPMRDGAIEMLAAVAAFEHQHGQQRMFTAPPAKPLRLRCSGIPLGHPRSFTGPRWTCDVRSAVANWL